tara:strand:- start:1625 stop:2317 length:693 start_codon:yes stop_codon:yes gene_type:complete
MDATVKYPDDFSITYDLIESHLKHAPMKATQKGKIWERKLYNIYSELLHDNMIAIDIGAYIGTHTLPMSKFCEKVYAFEANTIIASYLLTNKIKNNIDNVTVFAAALSNKNDTSTFYKRDDGTSRISNSREIKGTKETLYTHTLSEFILPQDVERIKLIKIDVEGHEFEVLEGAKEIIEKSRPCILIEVFKHKLKNLNEWCSKNNYNIESLLGEDYYLTPSSHNTSSQPD